MSRILLRRGIKADLPALTVGEPGFATDTKELYIGASGGNQKLVSASSLTQTWIAATLLNAWVTAFQTEAPASYYKDDIGMVHVRGLIKSGTVTVGTVIAQLPAGYRPGYAVRFSVPCNGTQLANIFVKTTGEITIDNCPSNGSLAIDFNFRAEQ